jgi:hypothetical protein
MLQPISLADVVLVASGTVLLLALPGYSVLHSLGLTKTSRNDFLSNLASSSVLGYCIISILFQFVANIAGGFWFLTAVVLAMSIHGAIIAIRGTWLRLRPKFPLLK